MAAFTLSAVAAPLPQDKEAQQLNQRGVKLGVGKRVDVALRNGTTIKGLVAAIEDPSFTVAALQTGRESISAAVVSAQKLLVRTDRQRDTTAHEMQRLNTNMTAPKMTMLQTFCRNMRGFSSRRSEGPLLIHMTPVLSLM
jgi:hypothetical protein